MLGAQRLVGGKWPPTFESLPIPGLFVTREEGEAILAGLSDGLQIQFSLSVLVESRSSRNVIATKASASGRIIYISAHMDTVPTSPGANDNASGVAVALELARSIKEWELDVTVRFIFSGAHETLSSGAEYYARTMSDDELKNALYMIDLDMVGWQKADVLFLVGFGEGRTCMDRPNVALTESRAAATYWQGVRGGFYRAEQCVVSPLDSWFFHGRGIPTVRYKLLWFNPARERGEDDPNHHLPGDDLSNVSPAPVGLTGAVLELTLASHRLQGR